jgi:hypothetical protein
MFRHTVNYARYEELMQIFGKHVKERCHLGNINIDGKVILNWILRFSFRDCGKNSS